MNERRSKGNELQKYSKGETEEKEREEGRKNYKNNQEIREKKKKIEEKTS